MTTGNASRVAAQPPSSAEVTELSDIFVITGTDKIDSTFLPPVLINTCCSLPITFALVIVAFT